MPWIHVTNTSAIAPGNAKEFSLNIDHNSVDIFILHSSQFFFAYLNKCPHTGVTLNWQPDQFFDIDNRFIQCSTHGALFQINDGYCVRGPCVGAKLQSLPLKIDANEIFVQIN